MRDNNIIIFPSSSETAVWALCVCVSTHPHPRACVFYLFISWMSVSGQLLLQLRVAMVTAELQAEVEASTVFEVDAVA